VTESNAGSNQPLSFSLDPAVTRVNVFAINPATTSIGSISIGAASPVDLFLGLGSVPVTSEELLPEVANNFGGVVSTSVSVHFSGAWGGNLTGPISVHTIARVQLLGDIQANVTTTNAGSLSSVDLGWLEANRISNGASVLSSGTIGNIVLRGTGIAFDGSITSTNGAINRLDVEQGNADTPTLPVSITTVAGLRVLNVGSRLPNGTLLGGNVFGDIFSSGQTEQVTLRNSITGTFVVGNVATSSAGCCPPDLCLNGPATFLVEGDVFGSIDIDTLNGRLRVEGDVTGTGSRPSIHIGEVRGAVYVLGDIGDMQIDGDLFFCDPELPTALWIAGQAGHIRIDGEVRRGDLTENIGFSLKVDQAESREIQGDLLAALCSTSDGPAEVSHVRTGRFDATYSGTEQLMLLGSPLSVRLGSISTSLEGPLASVSMSSLGSAATFALDNEFFFGQIVVRNPGSLQGAIVLGAGQGGGGISQWDFSRINVGNILLTNSQYDQLPESFGGGVITTRFGGLQAAQCSPVNLDFSDRPTSTDFARWPAASPWRSVFMYFYVPVFVANPLEPAVEVLWFDPNFSERVVPVTSSILAEVDPADPRRLILRAKPPVVLPAGIYVVRPTADMNLKADFPVEVPGDTGQEFFYTFALSYDCDFNGIADSPQEYCYSSAPCNDIDFNNDGNYFDPQDTEDFFSVFSEGACSTSFCDSIDFNNDSVLFDPADTEAFLRVFSEGPCAP